MAAELHGTARGHAAVRATHAKTLELVREGEIGSAATCVVGVGASLDEEAAAAVDGRVELVISAGGATDSVRGRLNPAFRPGDPLIVRRSAAVTRDALVIDADRGAADLDRELVAELARPDGLVEVVLREAPGEAPGVLLVDPGPAWGGRRLLGKGEEVLAALGRGERVECGWDPVLVATAHDAGHTVLPTPGLPPVIAAVAVSGAASDRLRLGAGRPEPGTTRIAVDLPGDRVERALRGAERGMIALDPGTPREQFLPWRAGGEPVRIDGGARRRAIVVAGPAPAAGALDHAVATLARVLIEHGATPRDVTRAVQEATGLPRSAAYEAVLELGS